jgi:putative ATPase
MLIFASEDVGLADPRALQQAVTTAQAFDYVGMPEGRFHLSQLCIYLATAPKSNSTFALFDALAHVEKQAQYEPPNKLKDASRDGAGLGHGKGYHYPHAYRDHYVAEQYLPDEMQGVYFYAPSEMGYERTIQQRLDLLRDRDTDEGVEKRARRYADEGDADQTG